MSKPTTGNTTPTFEDKQPGDVQLDLAPFDKLEARSDIEQDGEKSVEGVEDEKSIGEVADEEGEYPTGILLAPIVAALMLGVFLIALDLTIIGTAIPKITDEFHGLDKVSWYGSAFFMTFGGFQSSWGKFVKYFSLKYSFLGAIFVFEVGSLICAVGKNADTFIVGRAIAGVGGAGVAVGAFTIIAFSVRPKLRPAFTGLIGATFGISAVVGPLLGGVFTDTIGWRWCFYINLPVGGVSIAILMFFFKDPKAAKPVEATWKEKALQMDPLGIALSMGAIITFILAMEKGQTLAWSNSVVIGLIVGWILISITFVGWQIFYGERAMIPPRIFKQRAVWTGSLFQFFFAASYFIILYYLPIYFQSVDNASAINSGVRNLPMVIAVSLGSIVSGGVSSKTGHAAPWYIFGSAFVTISCGLIYTLDIGTSSGKWIGYQILAGFAYGSAWQTSVVLVQAFSAPEDISSGTAIIFFFQNIGGAFTLAAAQTTFVNKLIAYVIARIPTIQPMVLVATGATDIRRVFQGDTLDTVVEGYMKGVKTTFAISIALAGMSIVVGCLAKFQRLPQEAMKAGAAAA
ncbi:putative efflux pump antibiotic resistance protein [Amniculicola lignicola CBS 123094]|uniref:Putative efflux pump antibiotic resistance protein n=1 Tax=Amniculicola lignicola CBS 123094 TaxID=1392246 RepID=A0A6A5WME2_9PLEO|nr:putative efflux pump antibiotic resistance protein [Amniculicola lignicola CBS 123094]